ncbi:unnamed protein product [Ilex paraguariensis]|uniref:Uncharacterized protein n=1 Tax=Ilex paraguariensis TaxID=185542 RepID=A0ABC8RHF6_9AQUA
MVPLKEESPLSYSAPPWSWAPPSMPRAPPTLLMVSPVPPKASPFSFGISPFARLAPPKPLMSPMPEWQPPAIPTAHRLRPWFTKLSEYHRRHNDFPTTVIIKLKEQALKVQMEQEVEEATTVQNKKLFLDEEAIVGSKPPRKEIWYGESIGVGNQPLACEKDGKGPILLGSSLGNRGEEALGLSEEGEAHSVKMTREVILVEERKSREPPSENWFEGNIQQVNRDFRESIQEKQDESDMESSTCRYQISTVRGTIKETIASGEEGIALRLPTKLNQRVKRSYKRGSQKKGRVGNLQVRIGLKAIYSRVKKQKGMDGVELYLQISNQHRKGNYQGNNC